MVNTIARLDERIAELENKVRKLQFGEEQTQILISQLKYEIRKLERANVENNKCKKDC